MDNSQGFNVWQKYKTILSTFEALELSISDFIINLIKFDHEFISEHGYLVNDVFGHAGSIFLAFAQHPRTSGLSLKWSTSLSTEIYKGEVRRLTDKSTGLHFNVSNAKAQQISRFASGELISTISTIAPHLWGLIRSLMLSDGESGLINEDGKKARVLDLVCTIFNDILH